MPVDEELLSFMRGQHIKVQKKEKAGEWAKSFSTQEYKKIKEWLER